MAPIFYECIKRFNSSGVINAYNTNGQMSYNINVFKESVKIPATYQVQGHNLNTKNMTATNYWVFSLSSSSISLLTLGFFSFLVLYTNTTLMLSWFMSMVHI